jgi:uncharacterized membrane protein
MLHKGIFALVVFSENLINLIAVVIILGSLMHALVIYRKQYHLGIVAKVNSSIHMMEGLSMALSYLIATAVLKLIRIHSYSQIAFTVVLILLKKLITYFLNQDIEYAHARQGVLSKFI